MHQKKVRGIKRKSEQLIEAIKEATADFPTESYNGYWHLHLPASQSFIDSEKTPIAVKRRCMQTLLDQAAHLKRLKPSDSELYRVVVLIELPSLWGSQIIIFKGDSHFTGFFERKNEDQQWIPLPKNRNLLKEWQLTADDGISYSGFKEILSDEEAEYYHEGELWFIGDLE